MGDQYGLTPQDYIDDLKKLSNERYSQGMPILILVSLKQLLKHFQVIVATLMGYDLIYHIPQQDFPFVSNDATYIFSPRFSTSTGMFPILWPTTTTDIRKLRRKWSKLHVIYFSILIINWAGMM